MKQSGIFQSNFRSTVERRITRTALLAVLLGVTLSGGLAQATNAFIKDKERGWFWYEDPIIPEEEEEQPIPEIPPPPPAETAEKKEVEPEKPKMFSVVWLREQLPKLRERAIDDPSKKNVRTYLYAQRVMMDKADNFSNTWRRVVMTDPLLDENNRFPFATGFRAVSLRARSASQDKVMKMISEEAGIFYRAQTFMPANDR
ncbi:MAG: hypothetical protein C0631_07585 [Sedimenticola sp.]|nr:MAG: hypothetical protein C0631_07585 [Sedimenticola sp.]